MNQIKSIFFLLAIVLFASCKSSKSYISELDYTRYSIEGEEHSQDTEIETMIAPYRDQLSDRMGMIIGRNEKRMPKQRPNSALGNWFTDVLKRASEELTGDRIDFAMQNYGGLRIPALPEGDITVGTIFELMPFDNLLVIVKADGHSTQKLVDRVAESGGWPMSNGISFHLSEGKASNIMIAGEPLDLNRTYSIALPDYIANGGGDCDFLIDLERVDTGVLLRDALIDVLKKNDPEEIISVDRTKRISVDK